VLDAALSGLPSGGAYALVGVAVVLLYRLAGVMSIAVSVFGAFGAFVMVASFDQGLPLGVAVLVGLAAGAVLSAAMGVLTAWRFPDSDAITRSVVTIGMAITLLAVAFRVFGDTPRSFPPLFPGSSFTVSGVVVSATNVLAVLLAVSLGVGLWVLLRSTRVGLRMMAMSDRPVTAELLGIPLGVYTVSVWATSGAAATAAAILAAPTRQADFTSLSLLVVPGLAAALLGAFRSFGLTVAAGLGIGVLEAMAVRWDAVSTYRNALPFLVILIVLLWSQRGEVWDEAR